MKKTLRLVVFISLLSLCFTPPHLGADLDLAFPEEEPSISMDFQDASLKDILKVFSIQSGLNFIASEELQDRKTTLYLDKVPLKEAMVKLFNANNLSYELDKDSNIFIVKDLGRPQVETVTKVFYLRYATVSSSSLKEEMSNVIKSIETFSVGSTTTGGASTTGGTSGSGTGKWEILTGVGITNVVKKLLSGVGSVIEDFRTNSLIVTDVPKRIAVISTVIASLDVPVPQVLLEVEMLDVSKNAVDTIGFKFGQTPLTAVITGASGSIGFPFQSWGKTFFTDSNRGSLAINSGANTYSAQLDFLRTLTDTKFLARPKIITLNNETAEIRIATNESIGLKTTTTAVASSVGTTTQEPERAETGVILRVTPQINAETGEITMFIYPKVAEAVTGNSFTSNGNTFQFRDPEERSTKTLVRIKDGETVVIGGLIRNEFTRQQTKVPILGDIPILGALFRHKGGTSTAPDKNKERELLVFITPHIIKDSHMKLAQTEKIALPEREQNTVSGGSRDLEINEGLNSFEKKK